MSSTLTITLGVSLSGDGVNTVPIGTNTQTFTVQNTSTGGFSMAVPADSAYHAAPAALSTLVQYTSNQCFVCITNDSAYPSCTLAVNVTGDGGARLVIPPGMTCFAPWNVDTVLAFYAAGGNGVAIVTVIGS